MPQYTVSLESQKQFFSNLLPWENTTLLIISCISLFSLLLFISLLLSKNTKKLSRINIACGISFLFTVFLFWISGFSFTYGNSQGVIKGFLFFCTVPLSFSIVILGIFYVVTIFFDPFKKLERIINKASWIKNGWGKWISIFIAGFLIVCSAGVYAFFFQNLLEIST